jgi:hypothetical protein
LDIFKKLYDGRLKILKQSLHWRYLLLVALLFLCCPVRVSGTLVILMPTKDGLLVAADTRSVLASASLGINKACDGESKLIELAMVDRTVIAFVGSRRLFFPRSVFFAEDPCAEIERLPIGPDGLDVRNVVREYLDHNYIAINKSRLESFSKDLVAKVNLLNLAPALKTLAGRTLFGINVGSYDVSASKSLIGTFRISLTTQAIAEVRDLNWQEIDQNAEGRAIPKGEVPYLINQVLNGPGRKYLGHFDFKNRPVSDISAKEAMAYVVNLIEATTKTMEALKDSNTVGGKIEVLLVGDERKPIRLQ